MFDPIKTVFKLAIALMIVGGLGYTHLEVFKAGIGIRQHPLTDVLAQVMGLTSPSCPSQPDAPPWQELF